MREYNTRISEEANRCLDRRYRVVQFQKRMIAIGVIIAISIIILLASSIHAFARTNHSRELKKSYESIVVKQGDSLWDIAQEHTANTSVDNKSYIEEICSINQISKDAIHYGESIIVINYSYE